MPRFRFESVDYLARMRNAGLLSMGMILFRPGAILSHSRHLCAVCPTSTVGGSIRPSQTVHTTKNNYVSLRMRFRGYTASGGT